MATPSPDTIHTTPHEVHRLEFLGAPVPAAINLGRGSRAPISAHWARAGRRTTLS
jgi:hypothetical protein